MYGIVFFILEKLEKRHYTFSGNKLEYDVLLKICICLRDKHVERGCAEGEYGCFFSCVEGHRGY